MRSVLFVCPYGGAKSVIAASYFNQMAAARGVALNAVALAGQTPYDAVPALVAQALLAEGIDVRSFRPRKAEQADFDSALRVVTIDCQVPVRSDDWNDVPKVSEDLKGSMAAIRSHVVKLVGELASPRIDTTPAQQ